MTIYNNSFGVEIEVMAPQGMTGSVLASHIAANGVPCRAEGYGHATPTQWKVITDGSLSGGNGLEIVSPPLSGEAGQESIEKVCAALARVGCTVNRSCGLHVHVNARNLSIAAMRKLAMLYCENEQIIDTMMPASRRGNANNYCGSIRSLDVQALARATDARAIARAIRREDYTQRYVKLNFAAFWRHGTVEFRQHSGTIDAVKINVWVRTCLRMVDTAASEASQPVTVTVQQRPTNARMARIYDLMMANPEGVTREQVAQMLNRSSMPPMNRILAEHGIAYEERRVGHVAKYALRLTTAPQPGELTFDGFCARIKMTDNEKTFWATRRDVLNGSTRIAAE